MTLSSLLDEGSFETSKLRLQAYCTITGEWSHIRKHVISIAR
jgi:hypothetical protein